MTCNDALNDVPDSSTYLRAETEITHEDITRAQLGSHEMSVCIKLFT